MLTRKNLNFEVKLLLSQALLHHKSGIFLSTCKSSTHSYFPLKDFFEQVGDSTLGTTQLHFQIFRSQAGLKNMKVSGTCLATHHFKSSTIFQLWEPNWNAIFDYIASNFTKYIFLTIFNVKLNFLEPQTCILKQDFFISVWYSIRVF